MPPRRARGVTLCVRAFHRTPLLGAEKRQLFNMSTTSTGPFGRKRKVVDDWIFSSLRENIRTRKVERWRFENFPRLPARCAWRPNPACGAQNRPRLPPSRQQGTPREPETLEFKFCQPVSSAFSCPRARRRPRGDARRARTEARAAHAKAHRGRGPQARVGFSPLSTPSSRRRRACAPRAATTEQRSRQGCAFGGKRDSTSAFRRRVDSKRARAFHARGPARRHRRRACLTHPLPKSRPLPALPATANPPFPHPARSRRAPHGGEGTFQTCLSRGTVLTTYPSRFDAPRA